MAVRGGRHRVGPSPRRRLLVVDRGAFSPSYVASSAWISQYPAGAEAKARLENGPSPALKAVMPRCALLEDDELTVLDARCIVAVSR